MQVCMYPAVTFFFSEPLACGTGTEVVIEFSVVTYLQDQVHIVAILKIVVELM